MTRRILISLKILFLVSILVMSTFAGCAAEEQTAEKPQISALGVQSDIPSILPNWNDGEYHGYDAMMYTLMNFNDNFPDLVDVFSIGKSVQGRDIRCIRITNEKNNQAKFSCLIDGCIHGNEWEAGDACLYLADYLLINFGNNATVTHILNTSEVYIVPLVNPDGRQQNTRWNADNIDLNRNFDVDFGRLRGHSIRIGKLFGWIKIPYIYIPRLGTLTNCGRRPFSEPETQAVRDLMKAVDHHDFSFYVNCHTATHEIVAQCDTFKPPFPMKQHHEQVLKCVGNWVEKNTEYDYSMNSALHIGGEAMDWVYKEFQIPLKDIIPTFQTLPGAIIKTPHGSRLANINLLLYRYFRRSKVISLQRPLDFK